MSNEFKVAEYHNHNIVNVMAGLLIGGLAGAGAMLLLAPQSGERTREQIQEKSIELRDETSSAMDAAMAKVWLAKNKIARDGRRRATELAHRSKAMVNGQMETISEAAKTWKKANLGS
jgi:gas vesicle protein